MDIIASWQEPVTLIKSSFGYQLSEKDRERIPDEFGVYIFYRHWGNNFSPLYIGKSERQGLQTRITQDLKLVQFQEGLLICRNPKKQDKRKGKHKVIAKSGYRKLVYCIPKKRQGQKMEALCTVLEDALIEHAMNSGHDLLNVSKTRRPVHEIQFQRTRDTMKLLPNKLWQRQEINKKRRRNRKTSI